MQGFLFNSAKQNTSLSSSKKHKVCILTHSVQSCNWWAMEDFPPRRTTSIHLRRIAL